MYNSLNKTLAIQLFLVYMHSYVRQARVWSIFDRVGERGSCFDGTQLQQLSAAVNLILACSPLQISQTRLSTANQLNTPCKLACSLSWVYFLSSRPGGSHPDCVSCDSCWRVDRDVTSILLFLFCTPPPGGRRGVARVINTWENDYLHLTSASIAKDLYMY